MRADGQSSLIQPDRAIRREIEAGGSHSFRIALAAGAYAKVILEQQGIDVAVDLRGPDMVLIAEFDDEIRTQGTEQIELVAETPGDYRLTVKAKFMGMPPGHYEIRLAEARAATPSDRSLLETRRLRTESLRLLNAGKDEAALPLAERAQTLAETVLGPEHPYVAKLIADTANIYQIRHNGEKALPLYERALAVLERQLGPDHPETARVAGRLGSLYEQTGDRAKAEQLLRRGLEVSERTLGREHPQVAIILRSVGVFCFDRGDATQAEQNFLHALAIVEKTMGTDNREACEILNNLGALNNDRRAYAQAEPYLQRSLAIAEKLYGRDNFSLASTLNNLGIVELRLKKNYDKAIEYYERALAIREAVLGEDHPDIAGHLINIGNVYRAKGDLARSLEVHLRALAILERTGSPKYTTLLTLGNIARTYDAIGDIANAVKYQTRVDAAIETYAALNLAIGSERQKLTFLETLSDRTDRTISLNTLLATDDPQASTLAALVLLQRKGRVLDATAGTLGALRERSDEQGRALLDRLNQITTQLAQLVLGGPRGLSPEEHQKKVRDLEVKKEDMEAEMSQYSAEFRAHSQKVTLEAVQSAIPAGAALVELAVYHPFDAKIDDNSKAYGEPRYVAYVLRRRGGPGHADLGDAKSIDEAALKFREALRDPSRRDVKQLARAIDEKLMQSIRHLIGDASQLLISTDGELSLIPFEALLDSQGRFLVERYSLAYLSSGRDLLRMQVAREIKHNALVVADPAFGEPEQVLAQAGGPGIPAAKGNGRRSVTSAGDLSETYFAPLSATAQEARSIQALFPEATVLTGAQATESALKQAAAPRILHIATHGFFLRPAETTAAGDKPAAQAINANAKIENPLLRSGLALAGANLHRSGGDDNGILTALEASGLNLWGPKLVTEIKNGEGVYGLRRAFVLAGAESLVMSLWPVSDYVTRETMTAYYKGLKDGLGRGEALRQVKLAMLKRKDRQHPFYWASFIQSGEWANLDGRR
jgi:CHAT domain-containing protein/Tfp pilus assembly protein PilF